MLRLIVPALFFSAFLGCSTEPAPTPAKKTVTKTKTTTGTAAMPKDGSVVTEPSAADAINATDQAPTVDPALQKAKLDEYLALREMNQLLCQRVQTQRIQCVGAVTLAVEGRDQILNCVTDVSAGATVDNVIRVSMGSNYASEAFYLTANESLYNSGDFQGQGDAELKFTNAQKRTTEAPAFMDLQDLRLVRKNSGVPLDLAAIGKFDITVNGQSVFNRGDLMPSSNAGANYLLLNLSKFTSMLRSPQCRVSDAEVSTLATQGQANAQKLPDSERGKVNLAALDTDLERERSRRQSFESMLAGDRNIGCWSQVKMSKFELLTDGSHLENASRGRSGSQMSSSGNATQYDFVFGENIKFTNSDENGRALLAPGASYVTADFGNFEIGQLQSVRITKNGASYTGTQVSLPCFMGIGCWSGWDNFETNITSLASIKIKVNGELVYERAGIGQTFAGDSRSWTDQSLQSNAAFLKLMRRADCTAKK